MFKFRQLSKSDFPLLLKWLKTPHVQTWWDSDIKWDLQKVISKYSTYVLQFKLEEGIKKPIFAYIIELDGRDIGYIQYYDARDFLTIPDSLSLPNELAALDMYIGEPDMLGQGIGSHALRQFMQEIVFNHFLAILVTPDIKNVAAISCYKKANFKPFLEQKSLNELWLLAQNKNAE